MKVRLPNLKISQLPIWPGRYQLGVFFLLFLVSIMVGYLAFVSPAAMHLKIARGQEVYLKSQLRESFVKIEELPLYKKQRIELHSMLQMILNSSGRLLDIQGLLDKLSKIASKNGLELQNITPRGKYNYMSFEVLPIEIHAAGGYHQIAKFIVELLNFPNLITITELKIQQSYSSQASVPGSAPQATSLNASIMANIYWYSDTENENRSGNGVKK